MNANIAIEPPGKPIIVIIDDEPQLRRLLRLSFVARGYQVIEAEDAREGLAAIASEKPEVVILDLGLPGLDGFGALAMLREWSSVPVIVLSVRDSEQDKIRAFRAGADDYVTKPFSTGELMERAAVARRHAAAQPGASVFEAGPLKVDMVSRQVKVRGSVVKLTGTEYAILRLFVQNCGRVLTHPQILEAVWGPNHVDKTHYLHVYVTHLRDKIESNSAQPELLVTEPRIGYRLNLEPKSGANALAP